MRICPQCRLETELEKCPKDGYRTVDASRYEASEHAVGTTFQGRYRIESKLGSGGMGAVYKANQISVDRPVALKVIHAKLADNLSDVARFQQEARAIASLHHPNIVSLIDFGQSETGELFLVMEFLAGRSLGSLIREESPLEGTRIVAIATQIFEALHQAHANAIIHRDMKPENIFLTHVGRTVDFVKVLDFGIAKVSADTHAPVTSITRTGTIVGSPRYMAPEQARGQTLSGQTDLYAVGAMLYEMITGHPVFRARSATDCVIKHVTQPPPRPVVAGDYVAGPLVSFVMALLEKSPAARPAGAAACLEALEAMGPHCLFPVSPAPDGDVHGDVEALDVGPLSYASPDEMPPTMTVGQWRGAVDATAPQPIDLDTRPATTATELGVTELPDSLQGPGSRPPAPGSAEPSSSGKLWKIVAALALFVAAAWGLSRGDDDTAPPKPLVHLSSQPDRAASPTLSAMPTGDVVSVSEVSPSPADVAPEVSVPAKEGPVDAPKEVVIKQQAVLGSVPPGAAIYREDQLLGTTPRLVHWMSNEPTPVLQLRRKGYFPLTVTLAHSADGSAQEVKLKARPRKPRAKKPPPATRKTPRYKMID